MPILKYLNSFISLIYPRICVACGSSLLGNEDTICTYCMHSLPETGYNKSLMNPVKELFSGRLPVNYAFSLLFFERGSKYRQLVYQLKYKGRKEAGIFLGKLIGSRIKEADFDPVDYIVPVPLHKSKLRRRGYNQSEIIAEGIASVLEIPIRAKALSRRIFTATQTKKSRFDRWKNVEGIFECNNPEALANKHILLIDDVVTTGATLEAAGLAILKAEGAQVSVATAAYALP